MKSIKSGIAFGVWFLLVVILMWYGVIMSATGKVTISINGFGVDCSERIFVGKSHKIEVFSNNQLVDSINPKTSRAYWFKILDNDTILLSTTTEVYSMYLDGTVISERIDDNRTYDDIKNEWKKQEIDGGTYKYKDHFGRYRIVKILDDEEICMYQMPKRDYFTKIALILSGASLFVLIPSIIIKVRKSGFLD